MRLKPIHSLYYVSLIVSGMLTFGFQTPVAVAQTSQSVLFVPLIGITSIPSPLALPNGAGDVTYKYAVKNFLAEVALTDVGVLDNKCSTITFVSGDDNNDSKLDADETWRYSCTTRVVSTTQNTATAIGTANNLTAIHKAYSTVVVGSDDPAPLVSVINITKVAYPLSLPAEGGDITFTYRVNNPGEVPLREVTVTDDKCRDISGRLGDTNGNHQLDTHEVWTYTCTTHLLQTTTNTVRVTASANDLVATSDATITVQVDSAGGASQSIPNLPDTGRNFAFNIAAWGIASGILFGLIVVYLLTHNRKLGSRNRR